MNFAKRREPGEILTDTILFLKDEFKPIARLTAVYVLPFMILMAVVQVYLQIKLTEASEILNQLGQERLIAELGGLYGNMLLFILFNVFVQSLLAALLFTYVSCYIRAGAGNFSDADISAMLFHNSLRALAAGFSVAALSIIGLMLCILPGIILANSLSLAVFISVFENRQPGYSLVRSWMLVRRQWWVTLSLAIIGILFMWLVSIIFTLPIFVQNTLQSLQPLASDQTAGMPLWHMIVTGIAVVVSSFAAIVPMTMMSLQYFNLLEREKEEILPMT